VSTLTNILTTQLAKICRRYGFVSSIHEKFYSHRLQLQRQSVHVLILHTTAKCRPIYWFYNERHLLRQK